MEEVVQEKLNRLFSLLQGLERVVIAFSGGVDSTFLAAAAVRILQDKVVAVTAYSESLTEKEKAEAISLAEQIGIKHVLLRSDELQNAAFVANDRDRCYYCKKERFTGLLNWAMDNGSHWVIEGSNADDLSDYRPGMRATKEIGKIRSPLLEAGLTKNEIRKISQSWNLPTWNKPSAACLASRIAYGLPITAERLGQIEQAEECIKKFVSGQIRVRHHDNLARIEVSAENIPVLIDPQVRKQVTAALKQLGFTYVTVDLTGYRIGSMNETLLEAGGE